MLRTNTIWRSSCTTSARFTLKLTLKTSCNVAKCLGNPSSEKHNSFRDWWSIWTEFLLLMNLSPVIRQGAMRAWRSPINSVSSNEGYRNYSYFECCMWIVYSYLRNVPAVTNQLSHMQTTSWVDLIDLLPCCLGFKQSIARNRRLNLLVGCVQRARYFNTTCSTAP